MYIVPEGKLLAWLERAGYDHLLGGFGVPEEVVRRLREEAQRTHAQDSEEDREAWVLYSAATFTHPKSPGKPAAFEAPGIPKQETASKQVLFWLRIIAALIAGLLLATVVKGQRLPARPYNFKGYFTVPQIPHDPLLLQARDESAVLPGSTRQGGIYILDCVGAGITCTFGSNTMTFSVGGGGTTHNILSATHTDSLAGTVVLGDTIHGNATPAWARLAGNTTTTKQYLSQTGTGAVSAVPAWAQVAFVDLSGAATDAQVPDTITVNVGNALSGTAGTAELAAGVAGAGIELDTSSTPDRLQTSSQEANFLKDGGVTSLTCGVSNQGKMQVMDNGDLQFCDGAATSGLQTLTPGAAGAHSVLSATHTDTTAATVARGGGMFGVGATPKWTLVNTTTTDRYFKRNSSGDIVESSLAAAGVGTPTACTNQFVTGFTLNADAAPTSACATATLASAQFANQGTTTTVLHGNAAGNPSWTAVVLTTDVSGILPGANGGTGNGFFAVSGPTTSLKTFAFPDASATVLTTNAAVTVAQGGTGTGSTLTGLVRGSASAFTAAELSGVVITSSSNATTPGKADVMQTSLYCQDAGASDTYACNLSPAVTAYVTGTSYRFKANTANTGAASINFNTVGALTIVKVQGGIATTLADNDIRAGQWVTCTYDGTNCQMTSDLGNAPAGSGDVTDVGPGCATGACLTDGSATTGTVLLVWEGTTVNANDFTINVPADPSGAISWTVPDAATSLTFPSGTATVLSNLDTVTRDFPLNCTNPRVKSLAGNAFFDVEGLTTADVDLTVAKFLNNVDGAITCSGFVPNELAATPAAKVIFDALPHVACGAATVFRFNIRYRFWGATTTDTALTAETEQSISGSTTAHSVTRATFPSAGSLANAPAAGDNVVVEIKRVGSSASDTCEQTGEVIPTSVKLRVDVKVKN